MDASDLYDTDVVSWAEAQAVELRRISASAPTNAVDWANVIEEIESVGRNEWRGVRSQLVNALDHMVRGIADPRSLSREAWAAEVGTFLADAQDDYRPSMAVHLDMDEIWVQAVRRATRNLAAYRIAIPPGVPARSPFRLAQLLSPTFSYQDGCETVRAALLKTGSGDLP